MASSASSSEASSSSSVDAVVAAQLFGYLSDAHVQLDPSGGTCCRSGCNGCVYLRDDGSFALDEIFASDGIV